MSSLFGSLSYLPQKSIIKQLDEVREKVSKTQELTAKYNKRMEEINKLNKLLVSGYVNNLNVIVDLSKLVAEYKDTLNEVLTVLQKFDDLILKDIEEGDIEHIRALTDEKLQQVNDFFKKDVEGIKSILTSLGRGDLISRINTSSTNFKNTYNQSLTTYSTFASTRGGRVKGGRGGRGRGRR